MCSMPSSRSSAHARHEVVVELPGLRDQRVAATPAPADLQNGAWACASVTNSLASTDASYSVGALYPWLGSLADTGSSRSPHMAGQSLPAQSTDLGGGTPRWGLHAKRGVIYGDTTLLGTYNMDPRSANLILS